MKQKVTNALKTKYANLGLGDTILGKVADAIVASGVTDETLEVVVAGYEPVLRIMQSEGDSYRRATAKLEKELEEARKHHQDEPKPNPSDRDEPEWFKKYKEEQEKKLKEISDENEKFKAERTKAERSLLISTKARELGIPDWRIAEGFVITDDMDETAISNHLATIKQNIVGHSLPEHNDFRASTSNDAVKEEAKAWAERL